MSVSNTGLKSPIMNNDDGIVIKPLTNMYATNEAFSLSLSLSSLSLSLSLSSLACSALGPQVRFLHPDVACLVN